MNPDRTADPQTTGPHREMPHAPHTPQSAEPQERHPSAGWLFWLPWSLTSLVFMAGELAPAWLVGESIPTPLDWLLSARTESIAWGGVLLLGPIAWFWPQTRPATASRNVPTPGERPQENLVRIWLWGLGLSLAAVLLARQTGNRFRNFPPALHDEFSYLFQAETFLAGRTWFSSPPLPELFDQMHVLNDGKMASRYFPSTGLWLAPWVALGNPWLGWWVAQGVLVGVMFWIGRESTTVRGSIATAILCALSPGLLLFAQLLLAHHPTLMGLALMQGALLRMVRTGHRRWGVLAGCGLGFAALARPMTAVGIGLPWGVWLLVRGLRNNPEIRLWPWVAAPLLAAGAGQLWYDTQITGDPWQTPYGVYTARHTPRHVYGFDNVVRGSQVDAPRRIVNYDDWAENLTPRLALRNVAYRLFSSLQWSWGILPVVLGVSLALVAWRTIPIPVRLSLASIATLHLVHVPYWYDGIYHFHYVFESLPQWLLVLAAAASTSSQVFAEAGRPQVVRWGFLVMAVALGLNLTTSQGLWSAPLIDGLSQIEFGRSQQQRFRQLLQSQATETPALVLVTPDPSDLHIDYVVNTPPLEGPLLIARDLPERYSLAQIRNAWPGRTIYRYVVSTQRLERVP